MIVAGLLAGWLAMVVAGDTPVGRAMRRVAVEAPARALNRVHRGQWLMLAGLLVFCAVLGWVSEGQALQALVMGAPELTGMLASVEIGAFVDLLAVALVTASAVRLRTAAAVVRGWTGRRGARARRARPTVRRETPANDDEDRGRLRAA